MNKYPLMGKYVEVKAYLKPRRKFGARSHELTVLDELRVGIVVGYRTIYEGIINPGSNPNDFSDDFTYRPPCFIPTMSIKVLLVSFWPTYNPVLVKPEDVGTITHINGLYLNYRGMLVQGPYPTTCKWSKDAKEELRKEMACYPRDAKGRWMK
jgi:hypothetical protein